MIVARNFFLFALTVALALGIAQPALADDAIPLNVVVIPADSAAEVFYAQDLGYFRAAGLDVHISQMTSSPAVISALVSGSVDIGNSVVGSAVAARSRGIGVRFIAPAGLYLASTPTSDLCALKDSPLRTASDFAGKTVAVTGLADLTYYAAKAWIDQNGGNAANVKFVELPLPEMVPALEQHRVDAAMLVEPFTAVGGDKLRVVSLADSSIAKRFLATGWLTSDSFLSTHADAAARFAAVMKKTADWANTHHKESAQILLRYTKLTPELAGKMIRATYGTTLDPADLDPVIANAEKYGKLPRPVTGAELTWTAPSK